MSRLSTIARVLRERLSALGEDVRADDDQESTTGGVIVAYGVRALAELRRAPCIVIVPTSSTITPSQSTQAPVLGGRAVEKVADDLYEVAIHVLTPRSEDEAESYEYQDRLVANVLCALGRSELSPSVGAETFGGIDYPDPGAYGSHSLAAVVVYRVSCMVVASAPATDLVLTAPYPSPQAAEQTTLVEVEAL